ncbi:MAG: VanZ family protein, partial [bacterium]
LILLVFMFPFDISIDVDDIKRGIKEINITPFYYTQNSPSIIDMGINIFIFIIFGFLGYASFRIYHSRLLAIFITIFLGFCLATLIEFFQIFMVSRFSDITEIIIRVIVTLLGVIMAFINYKGVRKGIFSC